MGTESEAAEPIGAVLEKHEGPGHDFLRGDPVSDIDHFVEPPGPDGWGWHFGHELGERFDIENGCGSPFLKFIKSFGDGLKIIIFGEAAFESVDPADPAGKAVLVKDRLSHHGIIEMTMGIDQARQ